VSRRGRDAASGIVPIEPRRNEASKPLTVELLAPRPQDQFAFATRIALACGVVGPVGTDEHEVLGRGALVIHIMTWIVASCGMPRYPQIGRKPHPPL
jgi:hypothetical protein